MRKNMINKGKSKGLGLVLVLCLLLSGALSVKEAFAKTKEQVDFKVHAINLEAGNIKGDAVLVESRGEFLLIDTGEEDKTHQVINYLKKMGVTKLSIYISHFHSDHMGELMNILECGEFQIENLYVGERSILSNALAEAESDGEISEGEKKRLKATLAKYDGLERKAGKKTYHKNFVAVKAGSSFSLGAATVETIAVPEFSLSDFSNDSSKDTSLSETKLEHYMNNTSLCTMIHAPSGGKTIKYLTCGDLEEEGEKWLLKQGISLNCDLFKMNHHGTDTSNTKKFLAAVLPKNSFSTHYVNDAEIKRQNAVYKKYKVKQTETKLTAKKNLYGLIRTLKPMTEAEKYGQVYRTQFNDTIIFKADGKEIRAESVNGFFRKNGKTYLYWNNKKVTGNKEGFITGYCGSLFKADKDGALTSGFYTYKGKKYYCYGSNNMAVIDYGFYKVGENSYYSGPYCPYAATGWKMINNKRYYFDTKTAIMAENCVKKVKDSYIYFTKSGLQYSGKGWVTVGGNKYYITDKAKGTGKVFTKGQLTIDGKKYYFQKDGKLKKKRK